MKQSHPEKPHTRIAIHSAPRSGSTWLGEILNSSPTVNYSYQPLFSYAYKGKLTTSSSKEEIIDFFEKISKSNDDFINQVEKRKSGDLPSFIKHPEPEAIAYKEVRYHHLLPHLLANDDKLKAILLIRNPLSVINSWLRAPKEFREDLGWNELTEWRNAPNKNLDRPEEFNGFEKWKDSTRIFLSLKQTYPTRICLVKYSDLLNSPLAETKRIFGFCDLPITEQTTSFLDQSLKYKNEDAYSVYREKQTDQKWITQLNPVIANKIINELIDTDLRVYLDLQDQSFLNQET